MQTHIRKLRGRFYSSSLQRPLQTVIATRCSPHPHQYYPFAESVLASPKLQPYVHDLEATVVERRNTYRYRVFFKRHCRLSINLSLYGLNPESRLRGDVVVMRVGSKGDGALVNMRERDTVISDYLVAK
jgi:hypothetical protein